MRRGILWADLSDSTVTRTVLLGQRVHFLHEKENLYSNGLVLPQQEAEEIQRMYLWWFITAVPLLWDTVWLKGKTLHSLVLVGTAVVFPCHFPPGFEVWCLIGTVAHFLQCSREKCETQQWWLWEQRLLGGRFIVFTWCILLLHESRPASNTILNAPWSLPQGTCWLLHKTQGCSNEKWYKQ